MIPEGKCQTLELRTQFSHLANSEVVHQGEAEALCEAKRTCEVMFLRGFLTPNSPCFVPVVVYVCRDID